MSLSPSGDRSPADSVVQFSRRFLDLKENIEGFVRGKEETVRLALVCLFAEGHLLIEDVPGVAKTSLARAIARSVDGHVRRIQFTPDLLPTDIIGFNVFDPSALTFSFRRGPVFANIVLGDEINRASPKTQSALLEVMAERQVTVEGAAMVLPRPFLCIATQNPIEHQGTYPLPEAQLDRFAMRISVGYPSRQSEVEVVTGGLARRRPEELRAVMDVAEMITWMDVVRQVAFSLELRDYVVRLAAATRDHEKVSLGVSPRGTVALAVCAQASAAAEGMPFVTADHIKALVKPVFAHRMLMTSQARAEEATAFEVLDHLVERVPVPRDRGTFD
jgi:MoxR-like ATPase